MGRAQNPIVKPFIPQDKEEEMVGLREWFGWGRAQPKPVSAFLPWKDMVAPNAIVQPTGGYQRSYALRGADPLGLTPEVLGARAMQANEVLRRFGGQWMLHIESRRRRVLSLPLVAWRYAVCAWIDRCRRMQLLESPGSYESTYFATLTYHPISAALEGAMQWFMTGDATGAPQTQGVEATVAEFIAQADYFMSLLSGILAECRPLTPAETFTYLHTTVSDRWQEVGTLLCWDNIGAQLADTPFHGGHYPSYGDPTLPETWKLRFCSITGFPHQSMVGIMRALDLAEVEYRWVVRGKGLNRAGQEQFLKRQQHGWGGEEKSMLSFFSETLGGKTSKIANTGALDFMEDIDAARRETWYELMAYADFTTTIMTWGLTHEQANDNVRVIRQAIEDQGFLVRVENDETDAAWFSMQPGNAKDNVNLTPQSWMSIHHLAPGLSTASWRGLGWDDVFNAGPWLYAVSPGNSLIALVNHILGLGHWLLLGPTRGGKSTLLNLLRAYWMQYLHTQAMLFDLDGHGRLLTYLLGGKWHDLGAPGVQYAPFQGIANRMQRELVKEWLLALLADHGVPRDYITIAAITSGLKELADLGDVEHPMTELASLIALANRESGLRAQAGRIDSNGVAHQNAQLMHLVHRRSEIHAILKMFAVGGDYDGLFDAARDGIADSPVQTFEMRSLLDRPSIMAPVLRYVLNLRVEPRMSTEVPMFLGFEDAAVVWMAEEANRPGEGMDGAKRQEKVKTYLQTSAKKGVSIGFSTHTLVEVFGGPFGTILQEACPTVFFMPNEEAMKEDIYNIYRRLGLEHPAIQTLSQARRQRDVFMTVRGHGQQLVSFPHGPEVLACIARNSKADHVRMDQIMAEVGPEGFAQAWFAAEGMPEAVDFFAKFQGRSA
jgi:type IV secretion system protein TrbE